MDIHVCDICGDRLKRASAVYSGSMPLPALDAILKRSETVASIKITFARGTPVHLCEQHALEVAAQIITGHSATPTEEEAFNE